MRTFIRIEDFSSIYDELGNVTRKFNDIQKLSVRLNLRDNLDIQLKPKELAHKVKI